MSQKHLLHTSMQNFHGTTTGHNICLEKKSFKNCHFCSFFQKKEANGLYQTRKLAFGIFHNGLFVNQHLTANIVRARIEFIPIKADKKRLSSVFMYWLSFLHVYFVVRCWFTNKPLWKIPNANFRVWYNPFASFFWKKEQKWQFLKDFFSKQILCPVVVPWKFCIDVWSRCFWLIRSSTNSQDEWSASVRRESC